MGLINKVDMVCLSPVGYGVQTHLVYMLVSVSFRSNRLIRQCIRSFTFARF